MKRSRTCQCLVDLDDTPKRTRSTPDLGALRRLGALQQRQTSRDVFGGRQNFDLDSALRLLRQAVAIPEEAAAAAAVAAAAASTSCTAPGGPMFSAGSGLMADSIVRSKGSLNEVTILEHEQFIGQESGDYANSSGMEHYGMASGMALPFGGVLPGSLFDEDSGDSSDYFCGVASSDEAEDDDTRTVGLGLGISKAITNRSNISALFVTPTTSDSDLAGQLSDSGSSGGASCDSVYATPSGDAAMGETGPLQGSPSPAWAKALREDGFGYACASSPKPLQGNAWRSTACPRVSVTVCSPSTSAASVGVLVSPSTQGDGSRRQPQLGTVSPPWPAGSPSSGWAYDTASRDAGSVLMSSVEESYVLMDIGRLRLAETKPPVVEVGSDPMWGCRGPPSVDGAGEEVDPALERHPALA